MANPKAVSAAINLSAFIFSLALVGISIAAIALAGDASHSFTKKFPPGLFEWSPSYWYGDDREGWSIYIHYNRSNEIKTYVAAAISLIVGLLGTVAFGFSFKRPNAPRLQLALLGSTVFAFIVATVCAVWSTVAEVKIKRSTCWFEPNAVREHHYWCSIENSACNALRFTDVLSPPGHDWHKAAENEKILNKSCLQFRHARFLVVPLAAVSLLLVGLYAARVWMSKGKNEEDEQAEARVRALTEDE